MASQAKPQDWTQHPLTRFFGSIWLLLPLLLLMLLVCVLGSTAWGLDASIGAIRKDIYAPAFNVLMGLLVVNLVTCTLKRRPYKVWMWGFLCTHTGVFTVMFGCWVAYNWKDYGQMQVRVGEEADSFEIEDERVLALRGPSGKDHTHPIEENLYRPSEPGKTWFVTEEDVTVTIDRYLPHTEFHPDKAYAYEAVAEGGEEAAELEYFFGGQSSGKQWLRQGYTEGFGGLQMVVLQSMTREKFDELLKRLEGMTFSGAFFVRLPTGWKYVFTSRKGEHAAQQGDFVPGEKVKHPFMAVPLEFRINKYLESADRVAVPREISAGDPEKFPAVRVRVKSPAGERAGWVFWREEPRTFRLPDREVKLRFTGKTLKLFGLKAKLLDFRKIDHPGTEDAQSFESDIEVRETKEGGKTIGVETVKVNDPWDHRGIVFYQAQYRMDPDGTWVSIFQVSRDPGKKIVYLGVLIIISGAVYMFYLRFVLMRLMQKLLGAGDPPLGGGGQLGFLVLGTIGTLAGFVLTGATELRTLAVVSIMLVGDVLGIATLLLLATGWAEERAARPWGGLLAKTAGAVALAAVLVHLLFRAEIGWVIFGAAALLGTLGFLYRLAFRPTLRALPGRAAQTGQIVALTWLMNTGGITLLLLMESA
jgi:hypothetical protein